MNGKKIILATAAVLGSVFTIAQSVSYRIVTEDPNDYKRSMLYVDVFNADTYLGASMGSALKAETVIGDRIMPWVQMKYSWLDVNTHHVVSGYPVNAGGQKKQRVFDIGSAFFLTNKDVKKRVKVVLSSHSSGRYTYTRYIRVPAMVKKQFGVEGGIYMNRRALQFDEKSHKLFHYKSADGLYEVPIAEVGSSPAIQPSGEYYKPLSMTHIFSVYGGIHLRKIVNLTIAADGSTRSHRSVSDLYLDVMFAGNAPIANVIDNSGKEWILVPQSGSMRHVGWKAGYTIHNSMKTSIDYNIEFGQKPGPLLGTGMFDNGTYLCVSAGFTIGFNKHFGLKSKSGKNTKEKPASE